CFHTLTVTVRSVFTSTVRYWLNDYASNIGFGIFHSGIEVYGIEYSYGGHPYSFSGVFENSPQDAEELGENFKFRQCIVIGETNFTPTAVQELIKSLGQEYRGDRYHLISRNCNHFSAVLAKALTGKDIPTWINRLANLSGSIPFLERCLPQEWLTPVALQQSKQEHKETIDSAEDALEVKLNGEICNIYPLCLNGNHNGLTSKSPKNGDYAGVA
ncbi:unnamed protein product, partial [Angiostrongylus costaricensis]|uniref:DUF862 domain-containing protein n=1 Tax=Angiostrongylus costaricensis TaxID=334426 RepID=A0A0R3PTJ7_ANGCS